MLRLSSARVSDHWKALAARRYAAEMLTATLCLFRVLVTALAPMIAAFWLVSGSPEAILSLGLRGDVVIGLTIVAVGYLFLRSRMRASG